MGGTVSLEIAFRAERRWGFTKSQLFHGTVGETWPFLLFLFVYGLPDRIPLFRVG